MSFCFRPVFENRLTLSDGDHFGYGLIAGNKSNKRDLDSQLVGKLIQLKDYACKELPGGLKIIAILSFLVLESSRCQEIIGRPRSIYLFLEEDKKRKRKAQAGGGETEEGDFCSITANFGAKKSRETEKSLEKEGINEQKGKKRCVSNDSVPHCRGIKFINPYLMEWVIKGRCSFKSELRKFRNKNGDGELFSFQLMDSTG